MTLNNNAYRKWVASVLTLVGSLLPQISKLGQQRKLSIRSPLHFSSWTWNQAMAALKRRANPSSDFMGDKAMKVNVLIRLGYQPKKLVHTDYDA